MVLTSNFGRLSIRAPELDGARLRTRQKRPKKTIGQNARQTPLRTAMRNGWRLALLLHAISCQNNPRSNASHPKSYTRAPSAPLTVRRGACAFSFLFPHMREGAERRLAHHLSLAP